MNQLNFELQPRPRFNGSDYVPSRDDKRLTSQYESIFNLMSDGVWRKLHEIASATGHPESSISAQLRHTRKPRFCGHELNKRYLGSGLYEYQIVCAQMEDPKA